MYYGVTTPIEEYNIEEVLITTDNISDYFDIVNDEYYFELVGSEFKSNNQGIDYSTAKTILTAKRDIEFKIDYVVSSEARYDKLVILIDDNVIVNGISGIKNGTNNCTLTIGQSIEMRYIKDSISGANDDCGIVSSIIIFNKIPTGVITNKDLSKKVERFYYGNKDNIACKAIKGYMGVNGVATIFYDIVTQYAMFYQDRCMVFQSGSVKEKNKMLSSKYKVDDTGYTAENVPPWTSALQHLTRVKFDNSVSITNLSGYFRGSRQLYEVTYCENILNNMINMSNTYCLCDRLTGSPVCGNNVTNMCYTYSHCSNLTGNPVCGNNVINMSYAYYACYGLTGSPACSDNVINMYSAYESCYNLRGSAVCGPNVIDMNYTYNNCRNLTGNPACGPNVTYMNQTYFLCGNLTGSPVCGDNVIDMSHTYYKCSSLTGNSVCGNNVIDMSNTYENCRNLTGSPVCGNNVTNMSSTYSNCSSLTGNPVCGDNVTYMINTYYNCHNLTGNPVCGNNVTNMYNTYSYCYNLTGSPMCGNKVTNMANTYYNCTNLTGNPVCGDNVTNMYYTYAYCNKLTGIPVCGNNVINMGYTYYICKNLTGNGYFYSPKVSYASCCFRGRNTNNQLSLYVPSNSTTLTTCLINNSYYSMVGENITWTDDTATNGCYYNTAHNIYIYPVANVAEARIANGD